MPEQPSEPSGDLALRDARALLRAIVEVGDGLVFAVDRQYRYTLFNERHRQLIRAIYGGDVALGRCLLDYLTGPGDREGARKNIDAALAGREVVQEDAYSGDDDRNRRCFRISHTPVRHEGGEVVGVAIVAQDVTDRQRAEEALRTIEREKALRESEARFRTLIEKSTDLVAVVDGAGAIRFWSPGATSTLGWTEAEAVGRSWTEWIHADDLAETSSTFDEVRLGRPLARSTFRVRHRDGSWRILEGTGRNLFDDPAIEGVVVNARDVTEQRRLQEQFLEAQKLESVGRLAGGVAHDFNNLLTAILAGSEAIAEAVARGGPVLLDDVEAIREAGERARELTRQLLAFARRQVVAPVPTDLNAFLDESEKLLRRIIPETIALVSALDPDAGRVLCDRGQLQQVVMNLAVNAADAMPGGGRLTLESKNLDLDDRAALALGAPGRGRYVRFTVRDSGAGLSPEAKAHLFEPFFTTKPRGRGTGLGLATVYGIVTQGRGFIHVESEPGGGSAFHVHLPRTWERPAVSVPAAREERGGSETILMVEDEPLVASVAARALQRGGYRVISARDVASGLRAAAEIGGGVDLLVSDVVLPDGNGRALAEELARRRPGVRVLFVSGYPADVLGEDGVLGRGLELLQKPFTPRSLLARVRAVLDRDRDPEGRATAAPPVAFP